MEHGYTYEKYLVRAFFSAIDTGKEDVVDKAYNEYIAYLDFLRGNGKDNCFSWETEHKIRNIYNSAKLTFS